MSKIRFFKKKKLEQALRKVSIKLAEHEIDCEDVASQLDDKLNDISVQEMEAEAIKWQIQSQERVLQKRIKQIEKFTTELEQVEQGTSDSYQFLQRDFFTRAKMDVIGRQHIEQLLGTELDENSNLEPNQFFELLERHQEDFNEQKAEFKELAEQTKTEYLAALEEAVEQGWLPINLATAKARIEELRIDLKDGFGSSSDGDSDQLWKVFVSTSVPKEQRRHALFHEFTHALSGRDVRIGLYSGTYKVPKKYMTVMETVLTENL